MKNSHLLGKTAVGTHGSSVTKKVKVSSLYMRTSEWFWLLFLEVCEWRDENSKGMKEQLWLFLQLIRFVPGTDSLTCFWQTFGWQKPFKVFLSAVSPAVLFQISHVCKNKNQQSCFFQSESSQKVGEKKEFISCLVICTVIWLHIWLRGKKLGSSTFIMWKLHSVPDPNYPDISLLFLKVWR